MQKLSRILIFVLYGVAILLILTSILSLFRNAEIRYLKMLDFPRIQLFLCSSIVLLLLVILSKRFYWHTFTLIGGLALSLVIHATFLIHYTSLVSKDVATANQIKSTDAQFSLLLCNVKMTNRKVQPLHELIDLKKPDLILLMEVDNWWIDKLNFLQSAYPFSHRTINEVAYGMVLYSKLPLQKVEVDYLTHKNVPSFESILTLGNGKNIHFHSIHPVPPTYFRSLPDNRGQEANALHKLGEEILHTELPAVVAGDLNDVVWSFVDNLTNTKDLLFDVRVGRGFYNSYNAKQILMRWPLDHVFVTQEFQLKALEREPSIGSDHFPIYVELVLTN